MKNPVSAQLFSYWHSLFRPGRGTAPGFCGNGLPTEIAPFSLVLGRDRNHIFRYHFAGAQLCALHCRELTGRAFLRRWNACNLMELARLLEGIETQGAPVIMGVQARNSTGDTLDIETLLLPLEGRGGRFILGSSIALQRPPWLGARPIVEQSLTTMRIIIKTEMAGAADNGRHGQECAERNPLTECFATLARRRSPARPALPGPMRREPRQSAHSGHLRVIDGGLCMAHPASPAR